MAIEISPPESPVKQGRRWTFYALLVLMELFWSLHYIASKYALREFRPLVLASLRIGAATLILGLISTVSGKGDAARNSKTSRPRTLFLQLGLFGIALNQLFFILGLSKSLASHSALIISISPVFVLFIARLKGMERLARFRVAGMAISILGVIALNLKEGFHLQTQYFLGDLITMAGILSFSYYTIISKDVARHYGLIRATFATYVGGALFLVPAGVIGWRRQPWGEVSWRGIAALGYMVLFGSILAYLIFFYALRHAEASRVASFAYLQPVMASGFSIFFLGERLTLSLAAGIIIILTGVLIAEHGREVFDWLV
jgi:drug/metabolite transporter (DMT)-like permease